MCLLWMEWYSRILQNELALEFITLEKVRGDFAKWLATFWKTFYIGQSMLTFLIHCNSQVTIEINKKHV